MVVTPKIVALAASLGVLLASCLADPERNEVMVTNANDEPIVLLAEIGDREPARLAVIQPGDTAGLSGGGRRGDCESRGVWVLESGDGEVLARRDLREEPLCDREPWVWTGEDR